MRRKQKPVAVDENEVFREIATRKIEAERVRAAKLIGENEKLRALAADLQKKVSLATAKSAEAERSAKSAATEGDKRIVAELREAKRAHQEEVQALKQSQAAAMADLKAKAENEIARINSRAERNLEDLKSRHERDLSRLQAKTEQSSEKVEGVKQAAAQQLEGLREQLEDERNGRLEIEARLRKIDSAAKRIGVRTGQITGFETETPEELLDVLAAVRPEKSIQVLRKSVRELKSAASEAEQAFTRLVRDDAGGGDPQAIEEKLKAAMVAPDTEELPPATAELVEEALSLLAEETASRFKGRQYAAIISAMASQLSKVLRADEADLSDLTRLVEVAESTELASAARMILKGAERHQQTVATAKLTAEELKQVKSEAREQKGKVNKLYAAAESGMAGDWALDAIQALADQSAMPSPDAEAMKRSTYQRVVRAAERIRQQLEEAASADNQAEADVREGDDSFTGLERLIHATSEMLAAVRRELMSKTHGGEEEQRAKITELRKALAESGKRGQRATRIFDEQLRLLDLLLGQWKASYKAYTLLNRDIEKIESSIEGQTLDMNRPLETEAGKRLYQIIHELSDHLPEFRSLVTMKQRMFFHLQNAKQRQSELKQVRETAANCIKAVGEPSNEDHTRYYQLCMARLFDSWAYLESVRGGSHSQLAVANEAIDAQVSDVMVWASSSNVERLTVSEQDELMFTLAYVRRLRPLILGIHDTSGASQTSGEMVDQFERRLDQLEFPPDWSMVMSRLKPTAPAGAENLPPAIPPAP